MNVATTMAATALLWTMGKAVSVFRAFEKLGDYQDSAQKIAACELAILESKYVYYRNHL